MYLHAGNNKILRSGSIIGIFDLDTSTRGEDTKSFLRKKEKSGMAESAADELPKSFVLYKGDDGEARVLFSRISTSALITRTDGESKQFK
ncbi:MAG: DUF370 domain-containing protein [Clostridia bacterium]|nr:DUF370 domain-containing protein [Clostridia bacterium]